MITGHTTLEDFDFSTTTSGTFILNNTNEITIESFEFKTTSDGNFIEVVKKQRPNPNLNVGFTWPPQEIVDRVWKEIYGVMDVEGVPTLKLIQTIEGKLTPGHYVDEKIEFDE